MSGQILPAVVIAIIVIVVVMKQINKLTSKIEEHETKNNPRIYTSFASSIQEKMRTVRADIESDLAYQKYKLLTNVNKSEALEKLSDMIRKLIFFETMIGRSSDLQIAETELLSILKEFDTFLSTYLQDGTNIANALKEELSTLYERLKNEQFLQ